MLSHRQDNKDKITKFFLKNSSLITKRHKPLCDNMLQCDELPAKLITPEGRRARCDELACKLITPQRSVSQHFTWQCDEWWVSKENFFAYSSSLPFPKYGWRQRALFQIKVDSGYPPKTVIKIMVKHHHRIQSPRLKLQNCKPRKTNTGKAGCISL